MKRIFTLLIIGALVTMTGTELRAQNALLRYADKQFELFNYKESAEVYTKAFGRKATYRSAQGAAKSYQRINDYDQAYEWWKTTIGFESSTTSDYASFIAAANQMGKIEEVKAALDTIPADNENLDHINIDSLISWYNNPKRVEAVSLESVNSSSADFGMTEDGKGHVYFASDRGEVGGSNKSAIRFDVANKIQEDRYAWTGRDFLTVYRMSEEGQIATLNSPVPDTYHFSDPFFMKEKPVIFYTVTRELKEKDGKKVKAKRTVNPEMDYGQSDNAYVDYHSEVFFSQVNQAGELEDYKALPFNSSLEYSVINPFLDEENQKLYFASDMPGGQGGFDLYVVDYDDDFNFGAPQNLGPEINTGGNERDPYLFGDNFYFSSDGHFGLGGLDIFSAKHNNGSFSKVTNMGVPYNSSQDDFAMSLNEDGKKYLSSNRLGGSGFDDIYLIKDMYRRFIARVLDCDGNMITDDYMAELVESDENKKVATQKGSNGGIEADIAPESDYEIKISKKGYFSVTDPSISTKEMEGEILEREYTMVPIPYKTTVHADLVYYDLDRAFIREDAKPALQKLATLMGQYEFVDLMVRSHTDARASDQYNEKLSNQRAEAVAEFLAELGIDKGRVHAEWLGEKELTNDCGDGVPCPEREHQLNRRSELLLLAFPDENKQYELPEDLKGINFCDDPNLGMPLEVPVVHFDFNKHHLRAEAKKELERLLLLMQEREDLKVSLEGHTDVRGSEAYNEELSEKRANAVKEFLQKRGIPESRIDYSWYGKTRPVHECESNCSEEQHQQNRRTEIHFVGKGSAKSLKGNAISLEKKKISEQSTEEGAYLIIGAFSSGANARKFSNQATQKGFDKAGYFFSNSKALFYCYLDRFDDESIAKGQLESAKGNGFEGVWVLVL